MSSALEAFGVKPGDISGQFREYLPAVPGRVAHIDADFIAYQAACWTRDELDGIRPKRTLEEMEDQVRFLVNHQMRLAQAETYVLHITPPGSTKGDRESKTVTKFYQGNRKGTEPPEMLDAVRSYMGEHMTCVVHMDQEADDGLCQAIYAAIAAGNPELAVLVSRDKDLNMVPGFYLDMDEEVVKEQKDFFGQLYVDRSKSTAKVKGRGTKYLWYQCLAGDPADNIAGLPSFVDPKAATPTKEKKCGPITAHLALQHCTTDRECYDVVREMYKSSKHEWVHWRTQLPVTWGEALLGDMEALWMRRTPDDRVSDFLLEVLGKDEPKFVYPVK